MTIEMIILNFIKVHRLPIEVPNHVFETPLQQHGVNVFGILHSPSTYAREFRRMRKSNVFDKNGLSVNPISSNGRIKKWRIEAITKSPSASLGVAAQSKPPK